MDCSLTQRVYIDIREKLIRGKLAAGTRLTNRAVAKQMGISSTPVREALNQLVSEGILDYQQGVGVLVHRILTTEMTEHKIPHIGGQNRDFTTPKWRIQSHHKVMCD